MLSYRSSYRTKLFNSPIAASGLFFPVTVLEIGDLVLWDGHVGIVTDSQNGKFIGAQTSTGVAEASYSSAYWTNKLGKPFLWFIHLY